MRAAVGIGEAMATSGMPFARVRLSGVKVRAASMSAAAPVSTANHVRCAASMTTPTWVSATTSMTTPAGHVRCPTSVSATTSMTTPTGHVRRPTSVPAAAARMSAPTVPAAAMPLIVGEDRGDWETADSCSGRQSGPFPNGSIRAAPLCK
jgi:hypothetical protein